MRALVLGGAGFIGTAACKELMRRGVETIAAGRKDRPYGTFTSYRQVDRTDLEGLRGVLDEVRPDLLLDLAAGHVDEIEGTARIFDGAPRGLHLDPAAGPVGPHLVLLGSATTGIDEDFNTIA
ncbi:MAG: NAD-dependent epimerase/dehydratase family protein [Chloroflexi bacterium]|nr:MAG: NAD-dependent epimerase/dehydratase family protein [Chloroflexota bacterium]